MIFHTDSSFISVEPAAAPVDEDELPRYERGNRTLYLPAWEGNGIPSSCVEPINEALDHVWGDRNHFVMLRDGIFVYGNQNNGKHHWVVRARLVEKLRRSQCNVVDI